MGQWYRRVHGSMVQESTWVNGTEEFQGQWYRGIYGSYMIEGKTI